MIYVPFIFSGIYLVAAFVVAMTSDDAYGYRGLYTARKGRNK